MASPPHPPQLAQPPLHPQQAPPPHKHTARNILLVVGSVVVVLIGVGIVAGGGDTTKRGAADNQNPAATKASKPEATRPVNADVACADQEERSAPCVVTVGSAFALGKNQVLAGWTILDSGFGMTIAGQAKNVSDDASTLFITVKFLRGDEVMADVTCNTGELLAGQIETMNCLAGGTYTRQFDKVTAEVAF
jgi:hypothetical protein